MEEIYAKIRIALHYLTTQHESGMKYSVSTSNPPSQGLDSAPVGVKALKKKKKTS